MSKLRDTIERHKLVGEDIYIRIGRGCCGSVWTLRDGPSSLAIKRGDGSELRSVEQDSFNHQQILERTKNFVGLVQFNVPLWLDFIRHGDEEKWKQYRLASFPSNTQATCEAVVTERVPAFGVETCHRLINLYCPAQIQHSFGVEVTRNPPNCILRLYLGRSSESKQSKFVSFALNNLPLWNDRARALNLPITDYARTLGEALAILHWNVRTDADDAEWVLARPRQDQQGDGIIDCEMLGKHTLWVIDFDRCRPIKLNTHGVRQAVGAFWKNDPYYPRPSKAYPEDQDLWKEFKEGFLETSGYILGDADYDLATFWVRLVEEEAARRYKREAARCHETLGKDTEQSK